MIARRSVFTAALVLPTCAVFGLVAHVGAENRTFALAGSRPIDLTAELCLATIGFVAALLVPGTAQSVLCVAAVNLFLFEELANPAAPEAPLFAAGLAATGLAWACLTTATLRAPRRRTERAALALVVAGAVTTGPLAAAFWQPNQRGCSDCPENALAILDSHRWSDGFARWGSVTLLVGFVFALEPLVSRPLARTGARRLSILAVSIGAAVSLVPRVVRGVDGTPSPSARIVAASFLALAAAAAAFPSLQRARRRAAIRTLAARLAAAPAIGRLEEELARAVGDATLTVAFPTTEGTLVDDEGLPVEEKGATTRTTTIQREGRQLATVFHAPGAFDEDDDVAALTRTAGLVIENERTRAERKAQAIELRASRRRLVEAADRERRRLEHDLHDGAQQQLVSLLLAVGQARRSAPSQAALAAAERELQGAIAELRVLTHGLFPPVLASDGLAAAIEDLELSSATLVEILELPTHRASAVVESTAYMSAALAVATANTAVRLRVRSTTESLTIEATGGIACDSPEWSALAERVSALEGALTVSDDRITMTLPCVL